VEVSAAEAGLGLSERGRKRSEIADTSGAARTFNDRSVECDDFAERQVTYQASRLYNSWFFASTRLAAA